MGGDFKDVVEFKEDSNKIARRVIKLLQLRGVDRGQRFEIDHNVTQIQRTVISYPVTAMYGRGASLETEGGGNTHYIDFADVEWKVVNGEPVDKPKGQKWVGDPDALKKYGRLYEEKLLHREGIFSNQDYETAEELLQATWDALQEAKEILTTCFCFLLSSQKAPGSVNLYNNTNCSNYTIDFIPRGLARKIDPKLANGARFIVFFKSIYG